MDIKFLLLIFLFLMFIIVKCEQFCGNGNQLTNGLCFNNIIYFEIENKNYRAGHFAMNSKGDMIIEYSYNQYRLFYGLKNDGKFYFTEITKEIEITNDTINSDIIQRLESLNLFVSLMNDINKEKEYLMSISSNTAILELHDFESNTYNISEAKTVFNSDNGIYSYIFQILEKKFNNENNYYCIYIINDNSQYNINIKKFDFSNFNFGSPIASNPITVENINENKITSSIIIDYYDLIAIFFIRSSYINVYFYNYNLEYKGNYVGNQFSINSYSAQENGLFFKSYYLYDKYIAFIYFNDEYNFNFYILFLNKESDYSYSFISNNTYTRGGMMFKTDITMNEFLKIDNNRFVFLTTNNYYLYYFYFFDLYNDFQELKVRSFYYYFNSEKITQFDKEISAFIYKGFLMFSATALARGTGNIFSILLMFGYPNGTDFDIDIFPYLVDTGYYNASYNLYDFLIENAVIENNIFNYKLMEQIKLVTIPDEIIFYNGTDNSTISNNDIINKDFLLKQNDNIIKEDKYYYLDYQYLVTETNYSFFMIYILIQ